MKILFNSTLININRFTPNWNYKIKDNYNYFYFTQYWKLQNSKTKQDHEYANQLIIEYTQHQFKNLKEQKTLQKKNLK